jgi:RNA polymerase sigma factor (sigma-70 family)
MISFQNDILPLKNQLYRLALRITLDSAEAEDIVQETLIKVWDRRESWGDIDNIEAFCFTICRNKALDYVRSQGARNESLDASQNERPDTSYTPSQQTVVSDQMAMVRHIVDSLPEKQKSCIQLRDFEGKQYKEIAKLLDMTEEQVKINIFRGRKTIKEKFVRMNDFEAK